MTEGPLGDEIVIGVTTQVTGDVQASIREIFQQVRAATSRSGADLGSIELPPIDASAMVGSVRTALTQVEQTVSTVASNIGARLQEGMGGEHLFANQREALREYQEQWRQFAVQMEEITRGNTFSRRGAQILPTDPAAAAQRAVAQYNQMQGRTGSDASSSYLLSEEARRAIQEGQITPPPNQATFLRQSGTPYSPGDIERVVSRVQESISKVALDGVEHSFDAETGQFSRRGGVISDPGKIVRLQEQLIRQIEVSAETAVREMAAELTGRPGVVDLGANPLSRVGPTDVATHELAQPIALSRSPQESAAMIEELLHMMTAIGAEAEQTAPQMNRLRQMLTELRESMAQPFAEDYRAQQQARFESSFGGPLVNAGDLTDRAGAEARRLEQATAAREQQILEFQSRIPELSTGELAVRPVARPGGLLDPAGVETRTATLASRVPVLSTTGSVVTDTQAARIGARTDAFSAGQGERNRQAIEEFRSRGKQAMEEVAAATDKADASFEQLGNLIALDSQRIIALAQGARLTAEEVSRLHEAGSVLGGRAAATDPKGQFAFTFSPKGVVGDPIPREQALEALASGGGGGIIPGNPHAPGGAEENGGFGSALWRGVTGGAAGGGNSLERVQKAGGEFLGSIARYQIAYAAIFQVQNAITGAIKAQEAFDEAQVPLQSALEGTNARLGDVADSFGRVGTSAGASAAEGVQAGTQGIFAFGAQGTPNAAQVGITSARAAMVATVVTGQQLAQVQQELIASTNGFNLGFSGQTRILDAATNAYHHYGEATGDILQALPAVAEQARQAGLSVEQTANLISLVGERTQATGVSAGTALGRIFQQMNSSNYQLQARSIGVDTSASQGQQLEQLAQKWGKLDQAQQNALVHSLTGSRGASALIAILEDNGRALGENASAYDAAGQAQSEYYRALSTLGGQLRIIGGDFSQIEKDVAGSGLGDIFGLALREVDPFLHGLDDILRVFDGIESGTHHLAGTVTELAAVYLLLARSARSAAVAEAEAAGAPAAAGGLSRLVPGFLRRGGGAATVAAETGPELGAGLGVAAAGPELAAGAAFPVVGAAVVGGAALLTVIGGLTESAHRQTDAHNAAIQAEKELFSARTSDDFRTAASDLATASVDLRRAGSGFFGFLGGGVDSSAISRNAANARYAERQAAEVAAFQSRSGRTTSAFFTDTSDFTNNIRTGLASMTAAGVPATRQLLLLTAALRGTGDHAQAVARLANNPLVRQGIVQGLGDVAVTRKDIVAGTTGSDTTSITQGLGRALGPAQLASFVDRALSERGIGEGKTISDADQQSIITEIAPQIAQAFSDATVRHNGRHAVTVDQKAVIAAIAAALKTTFSNQTVNPNLASGLSNPSDVATFFQGELNDPNDPTKGNKVSGFQGIQAGFQASQNALNPQSGVDGARAAIAATQTALRAAQRFNPAIYQAYKPQADQLLEQAFKQISDNMIAVSTAQGRGAGPAAAARAAAAGVERAGEYLVKKGDITDLTALLNTANTAEINVIKEYFQQRLREARAAVRAAQQELDSDLAALADLPPDLAAANKGDFTSGDSRALGAAKKRADQIANQLKLLLGANFTGTDQSASSQAQIAEARALANARPGDPISQAKAQLNADTIARNAARASGDAAAEAQAQQAIANDLLTLHQAQSALAQAMASANAISGDPQSQAAAQVRTAAEALAAAVPGTADYFNALKSLHDAQYQMHEALIDANYQQTLANIDQTDPVATARAQVQRDRAQLRYDRRRGAGSDVINTDTAALHRDTAAAQGAKFSQNLADEQNAYSLQEISASAYIRFLDHEKHILEKIAHRTRQQTEELQQVDQAIKAVADSMDGQFNLGDIHIPTPYEAQRYIQAHSQGEGYQSTHVTHQDNRHITVDFKGMDKREIEELLRGLLGSDTSSRSGTATRKGM